MVTPTLAHVRTNPMIVDADDEPMHVDRPAPAATRPGSSAASSAPAARPGSSVASSSPAPGLQKARAHRPKASQQDNVNKYIENDDVCLPPGIPIWVEALSQVDTRNRPSAEATKALKSTGYLFPEFGLFLRTKNKAKYLANWLAARSACTFSMGSLTYPPAAPETQDWRTFLGRALRVAPESTAAKTFAPLIQSSLPKQPTLVSSTSTLPAKPAPMLSASASGSSVPRPKKKKKKNPNPSSTSLRYGPARITRLDRLTRLTALFGDAVVLGSIPDNLQWKNVVIPTTDNDSLEKAFTPEITSEILWELCELNWRFELLALDRQLRPDLWTTNLRESCVTDVFFTDDPFGDKSFLVERVPSENLGLAALEPRHRYHNVLALGELMMDWPMHPQELKEMKKFGLFNTADRNFEQRLDAAERHFARVYCQTFADTFGRAPICPRRIPLCAMKSVPAASTST